MKLVRIPATAAAALLGSALLLTAACGPSTEPGIIKGVSNKSMRMVSQNNLRNIGFAYLACLASSPPRSLDELKAGMENAERTLRSPRDKEPYEIVWGVNPAHLPNGGGDHLLAWEKTPDEEGGRCVLMADCKTLNYLTKEEFEKMPKTKGK